MPLEVGKRYAISFVARPTEFMGLYVERLPLLSVEEEVDGEAIDTEQKDPLVYAGGYSLGEIGTPVTDAKLFFGGRSSGKKAFQGKVDELLVANLQLKPKSIEEMRTLLAGGAEGVRSRLAHEQISLWIDKDGKDESQFARAIKFYGT